VPAGLPILLGLLGLVLALRPTRMVGSSAGAAKRSGATQEAQEKPC
jgi:hypothetical protein